jgi:uncharacterized protein
MSIEEDLKKLLVESMKAKDLRTADAVRMIKTKIMERRTAKGFTGEIDDALHVDVISAYKKSLMKGREEFLGVGERGKEEAEKLLWEIEFCDRFLPKGLTPEELDAAVAAAITALGATPRWPGESSAR